MLISESIGWFVGLAIMFMSYLFVESLMSHKKEIKFWSLVGVSLGIIGFLLGFEMSKHFGKIVWLAVQ